MRYYLNGISPHLQPLIIVLYMYMLSYHLKTETAFVLFSKTMFFCVDSSQIKKYAWSFISGWSVQRSARDGGRGGVVVDGFPESDKIFLNNNLEKCGTI